MEFNMAVPAPPPSEMSGGQDGRVGREAACSTDIICTLYTQANVPLSPRQFIM